MPKTMTFKNGRMNRQKFDEIKPTIDTLVGKISTSEIVRITGWSRSTVALIADAKDYDDYMRIQKATQTGSNKPPTTTAPVDVQQKNTFSPGLVTTDIERNTRALTENTIALRRVIHLLETKKRRIF